ncbi:hypothetical protein [Gemmobacter denitrificans]|uniref:Uncharacterized protein n=1 Tax=Gemmobacter denitrificans TaxID=3123040 RepID=A0ABU8BSG4_9RHOB
MTPLERGLENNRIAVMERALQNIVDSYEASSELHTSSADCAANLYDHARAALAASQTAPDCQQATLVTAQAGQVRVKPLVWRWLEQTQCYQAECDLMRDVFVVFETNAGWCATSQTGGMTIHANSDAARNAHDIRRKESILAALDLTPTPEAQAWQEPVAWLIACKDECKGCYGNKRDRYSIVDARKYNAASDSFWVSDAAKNAHTITPLYAAPPAVTVQEAARVLLDNMPIEHNCWAVMQDGIEDGLDVGDIMRAALRAIGGDA